MVDLSMQYPNVVVPATTRGVPLKAYTAKSYDFPNDHSNIKPVSLVSPLPISTRVDQKNNNIMYN